MTIVLDDPSLWPLISVQITASYVSGSWRVTLKTVLVKLTLHVYDCVSQLYSLLQWYMIGVSKTILIDGITDVSNTCSPALTFGQEVSRAYAIIQ